MPNVAKNSTNLTIKEKIKSVLSLHNKIVTCDGTLFHQILSDKTYQSLHRADSVVAGE